MILSRHKISNLDHHYLKMFTKYSYQHVKISQGHAKQMCFLSLSLSRKSPAERTILFLHRPYSLVTPSDLSAAP